MYEDFLNYVRDRYDGEYWQALSREIALYFRHTVTDALKKQHMSHETNWNAAASNAALE